MPAIFESDPKTNSIKDETLHSAPTENTSVQKSLIENMAMKWLTFLRIIIYVSFVCQWQNSDL